MPGSPAAKAGLEPGDVVLTLDGKPMENGRQFRINVYTRGVGEQVAVDVRRGARTLSVRVPVVERESETGQLEALIGTQQATRTLGVIPRLTAPMPQCCRGRRGRVLLWHGSAERRTHSRVACSGRRDLRAECKTVQSRRSKKTRRRVKPSARPYS